MKVKYILILLITLNLYNIKAESQTLNRSISWKDNLFSYNSENKRTEVIYFKGAIYIDNSSLPHYFEKIKIDNQYLTYNITIQSPIYQEINRNNITFLKDSLNIKNKIEVIQHISLAQKTPYLTIDFIPIIKNLQTGKYEKLISFEIEIKDNGPQSPVNDPQKTLNSELKTNKLKSATHSVLASGSWYKIPVTSTGIYKLSYDDLASAGINVNSLDPKNIRIYGNGGGMLPENNSLKRIDDLAENAIKVIGEEDGKFDKADYILFYAKGPNTWVYDSIDMKFHHRTNIYSDVTYYFLNTDTGPGKRLQTESSVALPANRQITKYTDYSLHERDSLNLISSGRQWFGEVFDLMTSYNFSFPFSDIDMTSSVYLKAAVLASSPSSSTFDLSANSTALGYIWVSNIPAGQNGDFAIISTDTFHFLPKSSNISINVLYNKSTSSSIGWLDYLELNVARRLNFSSGQVKFRNPSSVGNNAISDFTLSNANSSVQIWDVTDAVNALSVSSSLNGSNLTFRLATDTLKEFIAFDGSSYYTSKLSSKMANQDLHGSQQFDMVIVSYPDFLPQAQRLAEIHRLHDNLSVLVTTPGLIYNEFSSGAQDITAIRDFMKMFYDRASGPSDIPKYLLLFGRGSVDYKNRLSANTNFVPTYESVNSLVPTSSYLTDDYFGLLDNGEGLNSEGDLDIGIGRFPVKTADEAKAAVDKVVRYISRKNFAPGNIDPATGKSIVSNFGDWKNMVCFAADDKDGDLHLIQADQLASQVDTSDREYNLDKIYFDATREVSTPGGQRYPDVTTAINQRVEKGALLINYTGHGGQVGWAHERVLEISDINKWSNKYNMPVFMTATCEFSTFDNPAQIAAGELVFLNPNGGGIALFTTTRLSFSNSNMDLNSSFYDYVFEKLNSKFVKMGDIIRQSKVANGSNIYIRNFVLLGDPALQLAYPEYNVVTTYVKGHPVNNTPDTLKALSQVTIKGEIRNDNNIKLTSFNGYVYPTIFDKAITVTTLGNDPESPPRTFKLQKNIIYKGASPVVNGEFEFSFLVPKDIAYQYGFGKISYYATGDSSDANGYYTNIVIGGTQDTTITADNGPSVKLYIDNTNFVSGGNTGTNPLLLALVNDDNGINITGNGIGHDITAVLDGNTENTYVLNDYYETDLGTYKSGKINFYFSDLAEGKHSLTLKVWNVLNNSTQADITFYVLKAYKVYNFPNPVNPLGTNAGLQKTNFCFEHNYSLNDINVRLQITISNISGMKIKTIDQTVTDQLDDSQYAHRSVYTWDGRDENNNVLQPGIYIYKLNATNTSGLNITGQGKILVLHSN